MKIVDDYGSDYKFNIRACNCCGASANNVRTSKDGQLSAQSIGLALYLMPESGFDAKDLPAIQTPGHIVDTVKLDDHVLVIKEWVKAWESETDNGEE